MSERKVFDCDRCKKQDVDEIQKLSVHTDRKADAAGSMENMYKTVDLCPDCLCYIANKLFAKFPWKERSALVDELMGRPIREI